MAKKDKETEAATEAEVTVSPETLAAKAKSPEDIEKDAQARKAQGLPYEMARKAAVAQAAKDKAGPAYKQSAKKKGGK